MHDALFAMPMRIDTPTLYEKAGAVGIDATRFRQCLDSNETAEKVRQDINNARSLSITGTPTFLFGIVESDRHLRVVRRESGAIPRQPFSAILDQLLEETDRGSARFEPPR
jgi:predicted DsbA family dithiol-disulfide isomerase